MFRLISCIAIIFSLFMNSKTLLCAEYYVSESGNDNNSGTLEDPFRSINKAIEIMSAGDFCYIRQGRYHEEITVNNKRGTSSEPLTITAYSGENVIFDGTEVLNSPWSVHNGNIYKTYLDKDIWQLFVDDKIVTSARWPNAQWSDGSIWDKTNWAYGTEKDVNGTQNDQPRDNISLASEKKSFSGAVAILNIGHFKSYQRFVEGHKAGSNSFSYPDVDFYHKKWKEHRFFLECHLSLLDSPNEWYFDSATKELYVWLEDNSNPENHAIRGKTQSYFLKWKNSSYISIKDIKFFGTTVNFENCSNILINKCIFEFPTYSRRMLGDLGDLDLTKVGQNKSNTESNCIIRNCYIAYTDGNGIYLSGLNNRVENSYFREIDYSAVNFGENGGYSIHALRSPGIIFRKNTIHTTGAAQCFRGSVPSSKVEHSNLVEYNHFYHTGLLQGDGANIQLGNADRLNIVRYNWIHDSPQIGIRWDLGFHKNKHSEHNLFHHNVIWNLGSPGMMIKGDHHLTYNNTCFNNAGGGIVCRTIYGGMMNGITINNAANSITGHRNHPEYLVPGTDEHIAGAHHHNVNGYDIGINVKDLLQDPDNFDFRPKANSILVDSGFVINSNTVDRSDITKGFVGSAPDIGAYERYGEYWIPGITWVPVEKSSFLKKRGGL